MIEPFRVFSGWDKRQAEAAEVFKFSVEENCTLSANDGWDCVVHTLKLMPGLDAVHWGPDGEVLIPFDRRGVTDFTYSRFLVPWLCGFEGRAVFADGCDQLCLGDVAELAAWDMRGKPLWVVKHPSPRHVPRHDRARSWTSLMLMDCAKLTGWGVDYVAKQPDDQLMRLRVLADDEVGELPAEWNALAVQVDVTLKSDSSPQYVEGFADVYVPKIAHWSYLSDPNGNSWIDRSGSALWAEWRERWRASRSGRAA